MTKTHFDLCELPVIQQAAVLLALDGYPLGGAVLDYQDNRAVDHWCDSVNQLRRNIYPTAKPVRIPLGCDVTRLNGGIDIIGTLLDGPQANGKIRKVVGLLEKSNSGILILPYAAQHSRSTIRAINHAFDATDQKHADKQQPCLVALNPLVISEADNEIDTALLERMAFRITLESSDELNWTGWQLPCDTIMKAYHTVGDVSVLVAEDLYAHLCTEALARGVSSMRIPIKTLTVAKRICSLAGRKEVSEIDLQCALNLVVAWRGPLTTGQDQQPPEQLPEHLPDEPQPPRQNHENDSSHEEDRNHDQTDHEPRQNEPPDSDLTDDDPSSTDSQPASQPASANPVSLPDNLLQLHAMAQHSAERNNTSGSSGQQAKSSKRGRVIGTETYQRGAGQKIHILATLQAAAPWQHWRRQQTQQSKTLIYPQDLRAVRYQQSTQTVTVFCVDASGSAAARRLNEAKAAVELLLMDCYVRRDQVAMIVFQGAKAQLVLPPTRSLVRVQRELARLPTGGGTPLASALRLTGHLVKEIKRAGNTPIVCLLTDGRANVDIDGIGGRKKAQADALKAATVLGRAVPHTVVIDIAMRATAFAPQLARALRGRYLPLPGADAQLISGAMAQSKQQTQQGAA